MAPFTGQILVGQPDPYHGGIYPTHLLWLSENSRPAWVLEPTGRDAGGVPLPVDSEDDEPLWAQQPVVWIPSAPEHILEDGILMIAVNVIRDESVLELAQSRLPELISKERVDLTLLPLDLLPELRSRCTRSTVDYKLVVTVLGGSSLKRQLPLLERYSMDLEVCTVTYSRTPSSDSGAFDVRGSLSAS